MKKLALTCFVLGSFATGSAFADTSTPAPATAPEAAQTTTTVAQASWSSADAQGAQGETRREVYHDLVHAKQDGEMTSLNTTLYAHH
jgi:hypothetical protein